MLKEIDKAIGIIREKGLLDNYYEDIDCSPSGDAIYLVPKKDGVKQNRFGKIPGKIKRTCITWKKEKGNPGDSGN